MKRLRLWLFNGVVAISALLCAGTGGLWMRSYLFGDQLDIGNIGSLLSNEGVVEFTMYRTFNATDVLSPNRGLVLASSEQYEPMSLQSGVLHTVFRPNPIEGLRFGFGRQSFRSVGDWRAFSGGTPPVNNTGKDRNEADYFVPMWLIIAIAAVLPAIAITRQIRRDRWRKRQTQAGRCLQCGYDLRASPDRCPECGSVPAPMIIIPH